MAENAVLFDIENTLIKEAKDVSQYYFEAIRSSYGLSIEDIHISDYRGLTVQETLDSILSKQGLSKGEINEKRELFLEELPYAHYNVAGHDRSVLIDGAKDLLERLNKKNDYIVAAASGQLERILRNLFERAELNYDKYFKFGYYGDTDERMSMIIDAAITKAQKEFGIGKKKITFISSDKNHAVEAHSLDIRALAVMSDHESRKDLESRNIIAVKSLRDCERYLK